MRSRTEYRKQKRTRVADKNLSILRQRIMADRKLLNAIQAVLQAQPSHKLLKMPSLVKKSVKHVVIPRKITSYDANPELVSQTGKTRTIYLEANEELATFALSLSSEDQKLLGVQTVKSEWTQEDQLHFMWRMRQWFEWVLDTWRLCNSDHITFVELLTTNEQYGASPRKPKKTRSKTLEGTKSTDALNVATSLDGWETPSGQAWYN